MGNLETVRTPFKTAIWPPRRRDWCCKVPSVNKETNLLPKTKTQGAQECCSPSPGAGVNIPQSFPSHTAAHQQAHMTFTKFQDFWGIWKLLHAHPAGEELFWCRVASGEPVPKGIKPAWIVQVGQLMAKKNHQIGTGSAQIHVWREI